MNEFRWSDLLTFEKLISTRLIRLVYLVGLGGIALYLLIAVAKSFSRMDYDASGALGQLMFTVAMCAGGVLVWRLVCEGIILGFGMYDRLTEIRDSLRRPS